MDSALAPADPLPRAVLVLEPVTTSGELVLGLVDPSPCAGAPCSPLGSSLVSEPRGAVHWVGWAVGGGVPCPSEYEHLSTSPSLSCSAEC
jgi:hypothetical protein